MFKKVKIIDRSTWGTNDNYPKIKEVDVEWKCPKCGEQMGEVQELKFYENDQSLTCHIWKNPCGHVAKYDELKIMEELK